MNRNKFIEAVRRDGESFRADRILIKTGKDQIRGKGSIRVSSDTFVLCVTLDDLGNVPSPVNGVFGYSEFWEIEGIIDDQIHFLLRDLPAESSTHHGVNPHATLTFRSNLLELIPSGYDLLTRQEIAEKQAAINQPHGNSPTGPSRAHVVLEELPKVTFYAVLTNFKVIGKNGATETIKKNDYLGESNSSELDTCHGELPGWSFGLIQRGKDAHVYLRSLTCYESPDEKTDLRNFRAFLNAIAFIHGQHAWPFLIEQRRDGKLLKDRIQLNSDVASTPHAPFDDKLTFNSKVGNVDWNMQRTLRTAYSFFASDTKLAREASELLFQFRESTRSGVPARIGLLTLCSLLESLIRAIYEERIEPFAAPATSAFEAAKRQVCQELKLRAAQSPEQSEAYSRLQRILTEARPLNFRMIYDSVIANLGFQTAERWEDIYKMWSANRHPLSHRMTGKEADEPSGKADSMAESKIAGAINCILLKAMGYSGLMQSCTFADEYLKL
jgi:hypothetical protein